MRKITIFAASFILVLVAGAALAQISDLARGVPPVQGPALEPVEDPEPKEPDLEAAHEEAEPAGEEGKAEGEAHEESDLPPPDTTAPEFVILHPVDGQVFETREVVFEGNVERGARVFAGEYEANVNKEGGWRIVLLLSSGTHAATLKAIDAAGNVATDSVQVVYEAPHEEEGEQKEKENAGEFTAFNTYGSCAENPPYDIYYGTGVPGSGIVVTSEYGVEDVRVGESGHWEIKVVFWEAPVGQTFLVTVKDTLGHSKQFEFTRLG